MSAENDSSKGPITQFRSAKSYMDNNKIPQMFQSLIASLMLEKPENHFDFLDSKLEEIKEIGLDNVDWETFVYELHPTRDPLRKEMVQDGNVYKKKPTPDREPSDNQQQEEKHTGDEKEEEHTPDREPSDNQKQEEKHIGDEKEEEYKPEVFQLTEAND